MVEGPMASGVRVMVEDARRDGTFMRVTWHQGSQLFVVSHWEGAVCVAATRIQPEAAPELVAVLVRGLAGAAAHASEPVAAVAAPHHGFVGRLRAAWAAFRDAGTGAPASTGSVITPLHERRSA